MDSYTKHVSVDASRHAKFNDAVMAYIVWHNQHPGKRKMCGAQDLRKLTQVTVNSGGGKKFSKPKLLFVLEKLPLA